MPRVQLSVLNVRATTMAGRTTLSGGGGVGANVLYCPSGYGRVGAIEGEKGAKNKKNPVPDREAR